MKLLCLFVMLCFGLRSEAEVTLAGKVSLLGKVSIAQDFYNPPTSTVATDASGTPTTNQTVIAAASNSLRVWTGEPATGEPFFYLYVSDNGGAATKVKMFRLQSRTFPATAGHSVSLGTSDGRSLKVANVFAPATVESVAGVTNTVNCDWAGPPIWTPVAEHILLPTNTFSFRINSDGTERDVFIKEFDGASWTPTRWLKLEASRSVTVRTSYRKVALANYAGSTLSVTAPAGSTIGGTKTKMSLTFPAITGTSRNVTNLQDFMAAVSAAVAGDEIVFQDGTYALTNSLSVNSFTANNGLGNKGCEGITFRSASGIRDNVIIGRSANTNGAWIFDQRQPEKFSRVRQQDLFCGNAWKRE